MKDKLLIIDKHPFGTLIDVVKWCEYAKSKYDISLICLNSKTELSMDGISIIRVSDRGNYLIRGLRYICNVCHYLLTFKGTIFIVYFPNCSILKKIFPRKKMHLDVRTFSVDSIQDNRNKYDNKLLKEATIFDSLSTLSKGLMNKFNLEKKYYLPLGADIISNVEKVYTDSIRLIYVGTFNNRNIEDCIDGIALFKKKNPTIPIKFDIIGTGLDKEQKRLKKAIEVNNLSGDVKLHGRIEHHLLKTYFDNANVGISYVPITDYYNFQPPTKTYEYLMSGLYCIATDTYENRKLINNNVGYLIKDNPYEVCMALENFWKNRNMFEFNTISTHCEDFSWKNCVSKYFLPILSL